MGLKVLDFYKMKPKLPFRFKTKWYTGLFNNEEFTSETIAHTVKSITLPKYDIEYSNGSLNFGDARLTVPTFSPGSRKLEITFEETNILFITNFLDSLTKRTWGKRPYHITIIITSYDEHYYKESSKAYICHLLTKDEPSFKRDGQAQAVTINATFIVDTIIEHWDSSMVPFVGVATGDNSVFDAFNYTISSLVLSEESNKFDFGKYGGGAGVYTPTPPGGANFGKNGVVTKEQMQSDIAAMKAAGVDTTNLAQVAEWLRVNRADLYADYSGRCATGVSYAMSIVEGQTEYKAHGNGKDYNIEGATVQNGSAADVDKAIENLKPGESIVVSMDMSKADVKPESKQYGHVAIIYKDKDGNVRSLSDKDESKNNSWNENGWKSTYGKTATEQGSFRILRK